MGMFLKSNESRQLIKLLLHIPLIEDVHRRHTLLFSLPLNLVQDIDISAHPRTHLTNIIKVLDSDTWAVLPDGTLSLGVMLENARDTVEGSRLAEEVGRFLLLLQARTPQTTAQADVNPREVAPEPTVSLTELLRLLGEMQDRLATVISLAETLHKQGE